MALSGSFGTDFSGNQYGGGYRLQVEWSATQNIANNTSTIMTRLYLISKGSSWTINSSASKYVEININGNISSNNIAGLASLGGNQKKEVFWHQVTVSHESDGTKGLNLYGRLDVNVTLSGVYYGKIDCSQWITLDTIPRSSTLTTAPDITAGRDHTFSINRYSSEFDHKVRLYVNEVLISELNGQTTGGTFQFTDAQVYTMYQQLNKTTSKSCRINLQTFRYGTYIGENNYNGTCYNWGGGVVTFNTFNFGDNLNINISGHPKMKHTVKFYFDGTLIKTLTNMPTGGSTVTWTTSEVNAMLAEIPNGMGGSGEAIVTSYWVNGGSSIGVWADIASGYWANAGSKARPPVFAGNYTYKDTNATTVAITTNNQHVIQGKSTVQVEILTGNKATSQDYSSMVEYVATLNGVEKRVAHSATATMTIDFGTVSAGGNSTLTVKAVDSRGLSTSVSKTVTILPYSLPTITADVVRRNNFETSTTIPCSGTMSSLNAKNAVSSVQLRYKETIGGTFTSWENFVFASTVPTYSCTTLTKNLDNTKAWTLEVKVTDKLGTTTVTRTVSAGSPIFFIDWEKKTLGINKFPTSANNALEIAGHLDVDGIVRVKQDQWMSSSGAHGLDMRNSDIKGLNAIYFNDDSGASDEGLNFLKTGKAVGSTAIADYDNFCVVDGGLRLNQRTMFWQEGGVTSSNIRFGGDAYSYASGGTIFDIWGNIKGQPTAGSSNTFSIQDADGRTKFICPIGKGGTGATELHAHTGGIKFHHNGLNTWNLWNSGGGAYVHFDMGAGRMKWNGDNATFEFLNQSGGWAKVYGDWNSSSTRDVKKNIETYDDSALTMIKSTPTYQYHYLTDEDNRKKRLGLIVEESPKAVVSEDEKSIEMYSMTTLLWKAVQELSTKVDNLENRITMR
ncbi:tail protein [Bacillus phage vB_BanS_Skywalker]|uniref:Minor tail protein n=1 Tax=Bacillus phage vB_BanS_Skywalker TaxID=2894789 RepID=A0AAE9CEH5_9CAUD|nr:tail protein [Bacillus phage vB_BanS_Skywalker]UGO51234.1 minor tail protein [Bacillus phage vB_BanS_Skywalker]